MTLLTLAEAAERLRVSIRTLEREIHDGRLSVRLVRGKRAVTQEELDRYIRQQQIASMTPQQRRDHIRSWSLPPHSEHDALIASGSHKANRTPFPYSGPGVYFLWHGDEVVYVGKAVNLLRRIAQHLADKTFDHYSYIECALEDLDSIERRAIMALKPRLNREWRD